MRLLSISLGLAAAGLVSAAQAQAPAVSVPAPSTPTPAMAPPSGPAPTTSSAPLSQLSPVPPAAPATPAGAAPQGAPEAPAQAAAPPPPTLPTAGDGAVVLRVLEQICVPLVHGGKLDQLGPTVGMRKSRRDNTWSMPLGGDKNYTITVMPPGVNKDVCQAEVHYAIGQDAPIVSAINIWSFLQQPELKLQANYVNTDADNIKRVRKSWEYYDNAASRAVNFTTWRKADDSPLNRAYDTGMLFYQERKLQ